MSKLTLVFGNKNYSSWSLRPWILLRTMGVEFTERRIPLFTDTMVEDLAPYFSNSKVPVLLDGDLTIWDSLAIMEYVSETYLDGKAWPQGSAARALARSISAEMHSSFTALRNALPMNCRKQFPDFELSAEVQEDVKRISAIWCKCRRDYGSNGPWLFGDYSIADAMYAPVVLRFYGYGVKCGEIESQYMQTVLGQQELQEWIQAGKQETEIIEMDEI